MTLEALKDLVAYVTDPHGPQLYRTLYGLGPNDPALNISSDEEWSALPHLTKEYLLSVPFCDRLFVSPSAVDHLRTSSGTSGKGALFIPHARVRAIADRLAFYDYRRPFMAYTVPSRPFGQEQFQKEHGGSPTVVAYDPKNPALSIRLARIAGVEGFSTFLYHTGAIGEAMKREGMNERIRFIEITGEICSRVQYEYLRSTFPHATIVQSYGSSEVEDDIGIPCQPMSDEETRAIYHPMPGYHLEIVDSGTRTRLDVRSGTEGDLLITGGTIGKTALPLIRFRIGDTVQVVEETCPTHGAWTFTVLGRTEMDFLKIPGGILRADEIVRVLRLFPDRVSDRFELRYAHIATPQGPMFEPRLYVEARNAFDPETLSRDIMKELRTGPSFTYAEGVAEQRYRPFICDRLEYKQGTKSKRILPAEG